MKHFIPSLLLLVFSFDLSAQYQYNEYNDWDVRWFKVVYSHHNDGETPEGVKEIHYEFTYKKKNTNTVKVFNENGLLEKYYKVLKNNSIEKIGLLSYDKNSKIKHIDIFHKGKLNRSLNYEYNQEGLITSKSNLNKKGERKYKTTWEYNKQGCLLVSTSSQKYSDEINRTMKYEYYDSCKLSGSTLYNKKGKLKQSWNYMCDETGKKETKKNENQVCTWTESSAEILTKVYQTIDDKGRDIKYIGKYTLKDTLILEWTKIKNDKDTILHCIYDKSFDKMLSQRYYKKGKPKSQYEKVYSGDQILSSTYKRKGKIKDRTEYVYDSENRLTEEKTFGKKGKLISVLKLTYKMQGN